jgi:hypothetical protein
MEDTGPKRPNFLADVAADSQHFGKAGTNLAGLSFPVCSMCCVMSQGHGDGVAEWKVLTETQDFRPDSAD